MMYNDHYLSIDEILHELLDMSQIIVCFYSPRKKIFLKHRLNDNFQKNKGVFTF